MTNREIDGGSDPKLQYGEPTLQKVVQWLTERGFNPSDAQGIREDIWVYQAYNLRTISGVGLPIGITVNQEQSGESVITMHIPSQVRMNDGALVVSKGEQITKDFSEYSQELADSRSRSRTFMKNDGTQLRHVIGSTDEFTPDLYTEVLQNLPRLQLEFSQADSQPSLEEELMRNEHEIYLGVVAYDLRAELVALLGSEEDADHWLDSPNSRFGFEPPRQFLGGEDDQLISDVILGVRSGTFS